MKHDAIELLARMAHVHATGEAGERIPWALLTAERRDARTHEAVSMLSGLGRTSYPTNPEGLTAPADIAAAACRPSETVLNILPDPQGGAFRKESGEPVIDGQGRRVDRGALD